jgi:post-segregation antitoxin (ccd killing protein)
MHTELDVNNAPQGPMTLSSVSDLLQQHWREHNREAVTEYNRYIKVHGCFSDGLRLF